MPPSHPTRDNTYECDLCDTLGKCPQQLLVRSITDGDPESMHVSNIVASVGRGLNRQIWDQFPARVGSPHDDESDQKM